MIRNFLALIGLLAIVVVGVGAYKLSEIQGQFDPKAPQIYQEFMHTMLTKKDPADAMVWVEPVDEGISPEEVIESMKSLATTHNLFFVGESPFYKQARAVSGTDYRFISFMNFCDVNVGMKMADHNNAYTAFMPCTISVVQNPDGKIFLYTLNMDFLIYGGKTLPPDLQKDAISVRDRLLKIMKGAAKGEF